jgi:hypothetical protein
MREFTCKLEIEAFRDENVLIEETLSVRLDKVTAFTKVVERPRVEPTTRPASELKSWVEEI